MYFVTLQRIFPSQLCCTQLTNSKLLCTKTKVVLFLFSTHAINMKSNSNYNSEHVFILHINNKLYSSPHKDVSNIFYIFRADSLQFQAHLIKTALMVYTIDNNHCLNFYFYYSAASKRFSLFQYLKSLVGLKGKWHYPHLTGGRIENY